MWYSLILAMVGEMTSGSYSAPTMFLGQFEALNSINVSIHLWWGATLDVGVATTIAQHTVLMTRLDIMSQEPLYMRWSCLQHSFSLYLQSEWP
jgi:hypothetical protein